MDSITRPYIVTHNHPYIVAVDICSHLLPFVQSAQEEADRRCVLSLSQEQEGGEGRQQFIESFCPAVWNKRFFISLSIVFA